MANILKISTGNPVQFYQANKTFFAGKNQYLLSEDWFSRQYPKGFFVNYTQKWQKTDEIYLQVQANFDPITWTIINCRGAVLLEGDFSIINTVPSGQIYTYFEATIQLADPAISEGQFYIIINAGSGPLVQWISEPQFVATSISNTLELQYTATGDYQDMWFDDDTIITFRAEARIIDYQPSMVSTVFIDQDQDAVQLSGTPFDAWKLNLLWCPNWVAKKVNQITSFPQWYAERVQFVRLEASSKFDPNRPDRSAFASWSLDIRPANNELYDFSDSDSNRRIATVFNVNAKVFGTINNVLPSDATITIINTNM